MAYRCLNHPERDAIGICVKCRKYICAECATRISGVNYCADCLPRGGDGQNKQSQSWEKPVAVLLAILSLLICSLIIGVFAVLFIPKASSSVSAEQWERNDECMEAVAGALLMFRRDCGRFPAVGEGLGALLVNCGCAGWNGPYLKNPNFDSWGEIADVYGTSLEYGLDGQGVPMIVSAGLDREFQTNMDALSEGRGEGGDDAVFWVK